MNKVRFFAIAACLTMGLSASAQFANSSSSSSSSSAASSDGWQRVWLEYNPSKLTIDEKNADDKSFTGFSVGYSKAFKLMADKPLFVEAGLGLQYSFNTEELAGKIADEAGVKESEVTEYMDPKEKFSMFSAKIPVNLSYVFEIPNSSLEIAPFAGITARYNFSGKQKVEYNLTEEAKDYDMDDQFEDSEKDLFDEDDMGKNGVWERLQFGWQIGVNARYNGKYTLGISYGNDFSEVAKKTKIQTTSITLGYCF